MKICLVSDLHIDANPDVMFVLDDWPQSDVIVIAGDTANSIEVAVPFIQEIAKRYPRVIIVEGNHEHWHTRELGITIETNLTSLRAALPSNVSLLDAVQPMVEIEGVQFAGLNGWYSGDAVGDPDYNRAWWRKEYHDAKFIDFDHFYPWVRSMNDAACLKSAIETSDTNKPLIVITHTVPHHSLLRLNNPAWAFFNAFFCNMGMHEILESELASRISYWLYGHTHVRGEKTVNGVATIANPFGRLEENPNWFPVEFEV